MKMKASAVVGKGEQTLLCDLEFELRLTWGKEIIKPGMSKKTKLCVCDNGP